MREATANDLPLFADFASQFSEEAHMPFVEEDTLDSVLSYINNDNCLVLVSPHGMAAAQLTPLYFNKQIIVAQELFWFIDKAYRGKEYGNEFLKRIEDWAVERGAAAMIMVALMSCGAAKAEDIYLSKGYVPFERNYIKYL